VLRVLVAVVSLILAPPATGATATFKPPRWLLTQEAFCEVGNQPPKSRCLHH